MLGAVASWGAIQVHETGFRAQYACVVTVACPDEVGELGKARLQRIADRYGAELVALVDLQDAAGRHGSPLPDDLRPPPAASIDDEAPPGEPVDTPPVDPSPDLSPEQVLSSPAIGFDGRPLKHDRLLYGGGL